jgi:hypothetical protein
VDFFLPAASRVDNSKISRGKHLISPPFPKSGKSGQPFLGRGKKDQKQGCAAAPQSYSATDAKAFCEVMAPIARENQRENPQDGAGYAERS